jgi:hypothetical protein
MRYKGNKEFPLPPNSTYETSPIMFLRELCNELRHCNFEINNEDYVIELWELFRFDYEMFAVILVA